MHNARTNNNAGATCRARAQHQHNIDDVVIVSASCDTGTRGWICWILCCRSDVILIAQNNCYALKIIVNLATNSLEFNIIMLQAA